MNAINWVLGRQSIPTKPQTNSNNTDLKTSQTGRRVIRTSPTTVAELSSLDPYTIPGLTEQEQVRIAELNSLTEDSKDNIGDKEPLTTLQKQHSEPAHLDKFQAIQNGKIPNFTGKISHFRKIRGDGSCYYRAIGFGILEQIVTNQNSEEKEKQILFLRNLIYNSTAPQETRKGLITFLNYLLEHLDKTSLNDIEEFMVNLIPEEKLHSTTAALENNRSILDYDMNVALRHILADAILNHRGDLTSNEEILEASILGIDGKTNETLEDYCQRQITDPTYTQMSEGGHMSSGLLQQVLGIKSSTIILRESKIGPSLESINHPKSEITTPLKNIEIILLLKTSGTTGHYDLLYRG